jgi:RNA polymerase sigma-70 factor (ECF subfamily)
LIDYVARIVGCRARAEDIVQEAFIRCSRQFDKRKREQDQAAPRHQFNTFTLPYLRQVVRNLAFDWLRRADERVETTEPCVLDALPAGSPGPEAAAISSDEIRVLADALAELPERTQAAFALYWLDGLPLKTIASELGVSVVRVHQLIRDAVRHGAARLDDAG